MESEKKRRVATAVGFLSGVITCLDAVRDRSPLWPPDALWAILPGPKRLELGAGLALIVVTVILALARKRV